MFRFLFITLCCLMLNMKSSMALMPVYEASDYYYQCLKVARDPDICAKQDINRLSNEIKKQYRVILTNPNIVGWHKDITENTSTMRDMFESWTAFRSRLCSLSHQSAKYLEKLIEEKISCNMYYSQHHNAHLDSIILLLTKQVPENKAQFGYLYIDEHDAEYKDCRKNGSKNCIEEELQRTNKNIKNIYKTMLEDEYIGKWNNGPDLKEGNYRDLYDSWVAYRNRMCSLSTYAYEVGYGKNAMPNNYCLLFFSLEKLGAMKNILVSAHSSLDDEMVSEEENDGGEAEGKSIKPLERQFDDTSDNKDSLSANEDASSLTKKQENEKTIPQKKINVPTWAQ